MSQLKTTYYRVRQKDNSSATEDYNQTFYVDYKGLYGEHSGWYKTEAEAVEVHKRLLTIAQERITTIEKELLELQKKHSFGISYIYYGDVNGIFEEYQYIEVNVAGYSFKFKCDLC